MNPFFNTLKSIAKRFFKHKPEGRKPLSFTGRRPSKRKIRTREEHLSFELLQPRAMMATLTTAIADGGWDDPNTWSDGVPTEMTRAIIGHGLSVQLDGTSHEAKELVIHGELTVPEDATQPDKTLATRWVHINSGGEFRIGTANDRYDEGTFTLTLNGTDKYSTHVIETNMGGMNPDTITLERNDGFLMTGPHSSLQIYGEEKLSFTKLAATAKVNHDQITVANYIERNFNLGRMENGVFETSPSDDGTLNWQAGDQIVIASSSYDYAHEEVRTITHVHDNGNGTTQLTLDSVLNYRHYGAVEVYGNDPAPGTTAATQTFSIDMRAEVALLSRNIKIEGTQDTDVAFGDRANLETEPRIRADGVSVHEPLPPDQVANGVGGHLMFMKNSGTIVVDGVQLDKMGQASQKGRYPIHWHLGEDRTGDVLRNSSITNSNNRGVTIHGTSNLRIEGVVLHDIHGHGFFFEDAAETGNVLIGNIALGMHKVGGNIFAHAKPGLEDPFVVDTHDNVLETQNRFESSAAFWITNPTNTFVGNISAGGAGTGFWYAMPRTVLGDSADNPLYDQIIPVFSEFGQFDYNTSHSTPIGLNFDRGSDIEDGNFDNELRTTDAKDNYSPRTDPNDPSTSTVNYVNGFTNYKATDSAVYHRGQAETIFYNGLRIADSGNAAWAVSETGFNDSLYVGHSHGNADLSVAVGGPRLYDGAGLHSNAHFAGFGNDNAFVFTSESSSFGPTMYHAFRGVSFENDGTYSNVGHAVALAPNDPNPNHNLGYPHRWSKAAIDLDGSLTGTHGGTGYSIVPNVDFLIDQDDVQPPGWDAWVTDDVYARIRIQNNDDGETLFPSEATGEPLVRFTAADNDFIDVLGGQNNGNLSWVQVMAKADSDGYVEGVFTVEFMRNGLPENGFILNLKNQDGDRPELVSEIQQKVDSGRILLKIVGAANYTPSRGVAVDDLESLRSVTSGEAYFADESGNLYLNTGIDDHQAYLQLTPGAPLQTGYVTRTIEYGTVIEAEEFDHGIDGIAYYDSDHVNSFGAFRPDLGVDATPTKVGDTQPGEWLEYTGNIVPAAYRIGIKASSTVDGGQIRVLAANSNSAGYLRELKVVDIDNTGGAFETFWIEKADLAPLASEQGVIRIEFLNAGLEVDSIQFEVPDQSPFVSRSLTRNETTTIKLNEFDHGGEGVAYHDTTIGNTLQDTDYRDDEHVDANEFIVTNDVRDGEWLEYTIDHLESGHYDITLRKDWGGDDNGVRLMIGESNSATSFEELGVMVSGDEFFTLQNVDLRHWGGDNRVLRVEIIGDYFGIDYLNFDYVDLVAPTVESVVVNDGSAQRSRVTSLTVTFSEVVQNVSANSFELMNTSTNTQVIPNVTTQVLNGKTVATLTFSGSGIIGGSLSDGNYTLTTLASEITDDAGFQLDGNGDGAGGDNAIDEFFRLYGDINGDRRVNIVDYFQFRNAFRETEDAAFDYNGDGSVNILDFFQFRNRFGDSI